MVIQGLLPGVYTLDVNVAMSSSGIFGMYETILVILEPDQQPLPPTTVINQIIIRPPPPPGGCPKNYTSVNGTCVGPSPPPPPPGGRRASSCCARSPACGCASDGPSGRRWRGCAGRAADAGRTDRTATRVARRRGHPLVWSPARPARPPRRAAAAGERSTSPRTRPPADDP